LIFKRGAKPLLAEQFVYYRDATFLKWSRLKAPAESDRIYHGVEYAVPPAATEVQAPATGAASAEAYWKQAQ